MRVLITFIILTSFAMAAPTDVLFDRNSSSELRRSVGLEINNSLSTDEAIAELCYGVDLCAQATSSKLLKKSCETLEEKDSDECRVLSFRQEKFCNKDVQKLPLSSLLTMQRMLGDYKQTYLAYIFPVMVDQMSKAHNLDFGQLLNNHQEFSTYVSENPQVKSTFKQMVDDSVALGQYTLECFQAMKPILAKREEKALRRYYNLFNSLINTLDIFPPYQGLVNRGTMLTPELLKQHHQVGNVVCYNGFTSSSIHDPITDYSNNPRNSFLNGKCTQRLYLSYEENGSLPGKLIAKASTTASENEVLFSPGACFRVDKVYPRTDVDPLDEEVCEEGQSYNFEMTLVPGASSSSP